MLVARHGAGCRDWSIGWIRGSHGCGVWKGIMLGWDGFSAHLRHKVGRGDKVRLWHDKWCGDVTLKESFPVLYDCFSNQAATISEVLVRENGRVAWNVSFARNFNDWEIDSVASFLGGLQSHIPSQGVDDVLRWNLKKNSIFDIRSFYTTLWVLPNVDFSW